MHARVAPMLVPLSSPMAWSHGTQNMVVTTGRFGGDVVFSGHGAGGEPTAVAVVSDILAVAQGCEPVEFPVRKRAVTGEFLAPHYLRFVVDDKPGIVSAISGALAKVGANIDSILQRPGYPKHRLPFVVTTEPCLTSTIEKAVASIAKMDCMLERPLCDLQITRHGREAFEDCHFVVWVLLSLPMVLPVSRGRPVEATRHHQQPKRVADVTAATRSHRRYAGLRRMESRLS